MSLKMTRRMLIPLRVAVSLLLVVYFLSTVEMGQLGGFAPGWWVFVAVTALCANLDRVLMAFKWNILLSAKGYLIPFGAVLRSYYLGSVWGAFLPSSLGGDAVRTYAVAKSHAPVRDVVSSILLERVLGFVATMLIGLVCAVGMIWFLGTMHWEMATALATACLVVVVGATVSMRSGWVARMVPESWAVRSRLVAKLLDVYTSYQAYRRHRSAMRRFLAWSMLEQWVPVVCDYCVSRAMGLQIPIWAFVVFIPLIVALSRVPISIGGFGVTEGLFVYFFSYVGVSRTDAFSFGLAAHLIGLLSVLPVFIFYSIRSARPAVVATEMERGSAP